MAPETEAHVGGGGGEPGLVGQRLPGDERIARKPDLVAVVAQAAPAVENQRPLAALALHVAEVDIVEVEGGIDPLDPCSAPLLPVEPPEIDPHPFHGVEENIHVGLGEALVGNIERYIFFRCGIHAHGLGKVGILLLVGLDAAGRVEVEAGLDSVLVRPLQEFCGVWKIVPVPGEPRPAGTLPGGVLPPFPILGKPFRHGGDVPVHIHHQHVEPEIVATELPDDIAELLVVVVPIFGPPVAKDKPGRKGDPARHGDKVRQSRLVVVAVAEEIEILPLAFGAGHHPWQVGLVEERLFAVVDQAPAAARNNALAQLDVFLVGGVPRAVALVQRPGGAQEVSAVHITETPARAHPPGIEVNRKIFLRKPAAADLVLQQKSIRFDFERSILPGDRVVRHRGFAVDERKAGAILEYAVFRPLQAQQPRGQHRDPHIARRNHRLAVGRRIPLQRKDPASHHNNRQQCIDPIMSDPFYHVHSPVKLKVIIIHTPPKPRRVAHGAGAELRPTLSAPRRWRRRHSRCWRR